MKHRSQAGGPESKSGVTEGVYQLVANLSDKKWVKQQVFQNIAGPAYQTLYGNDGQYVISKDWDNLIILDGCRYDVFREHLDELPFTNGDLKVHRSRGSGSLEYIQENFKGRDLSDTVLATANPFYQVVDELQFHDVEHLWATYWNEERETVLAEDVTSVAINLHEKYPNKRLIVHYMQPHYPFLGDSSVDTSGFGGIRANLLGEDAKSMTDVWSRLEANDITVDKVWKAYVDNLRYVAPSVNELILKIEGKTVITSDHGNAFGECAFGLRVFGHPVKLRLDALVEVPWYTIEKGDREIRAGDQKEIEAEEDNDIEERLQALGYQ
jgi:hypothetical protein